MCLTLVCGHVHGRYSFEIDRAQELRTSPDKWIDTTAQKGHVQSDRCPNMSESAIERSEVTPPRPRPRDQNSKYRCLSKPD